MAETLNHKLEFALGIPTTADWRPERHESLVRLCDELTFRPKYYREFRERAPNWVWSREMWKWAAGTNATHFIQLQDDIRPMPHFWHVLRAMIEANPKETIGLHANHPIAYNLALKGRRWFRTQAWLVGPAYVVPIPRLRAFLAWLDENESTLPKTVTEHEDVLLSTWLKQTGQDCWHPIPAITDVDLTIGSTYAGTNGHIDDHRRPRVTWHNFPVEQLKTPSYWEVPLGTERVPGPGTGICTACNKMEGWIVFGQWIALCKVCWLRGQATAVGVTMVTGAT